MKKKSSKRKENITIHSDETKIVIGVLIAIFGISLSIAPFFDSLIFRYATDALGFSSLFFGLTFIYLSFRFFSRNELLTSIRIQSGLLLFSISFSIFLLFWTPIELLNQKTDFSTSGGLLGFNIHISLLASLGRFVEFLILLFLLILSISLLTNIKLVQIRDFLSSLFEGKQENITKYKGELNVSNTNDYKGLNSEEELDDKKSFLGSLFSSNDRKEDTSLPEELSDVAPLEEEITFKENPVTENSNSEGNTIDNAPKYLNWQLPSPDLLQDSIVKPQNKEIYKKNALVIQSTLASFGVQAKVVEVLIGPTVVQYALSMAVGIKVSKIQNLADDLALALAAPASSVRIEAPIPGTSLVGIEVPNPTPNFVFAKELMQRLSTEKEKYELPIVLGKDIAGRMLIKDLTQMPHLLVAGATGTGKSVGLNSALLGLLMTKSPDELRLILVDPKMVEMAPYNGIPHLLTPVITDMELVMNALQWAIEEMTSRYRMLKHAGVRKVTEYNQKMGFAAMPYIVIVIDEMADLMLTTGVDVETKIVRLAQMSRAVGIHLILATQRPSVNVVTGLIKANVPSRIAFSVASGTDSRVIIDQVGAENLIGNGDMLFKSPKDIRPVRIQGAFSDIKDLDKVIKFIKDQTEEVDYSDEIVAPRTEDGKKFENTNGGLSEDPMFTDALNAVINAQKASSSLLQRKLRIGYNRAARLIDELEEAGAIGQQEGSNPRKVLVTSASQVTGK
jgi:S-DNA-T family DNA segregation ATPase FtsK/SpoIIIE